MGRFQAALTADSTRLEPVLNMAALYLAQGALQNAQELLLFLLQRHRVGQTGQARPPFVVGSIRGLPSRASVTWELALTSMKLRDWELALDCLRLVDDPALPDAPRVFGPPSLDDGVLSSPESLGWSGHVRLAHTMVLLQLGRPQEALSLMGSSCAPPAWDPRLLLHAADSLVCLGQWALPEKAALSKAGAPRALDQLVASALGALAFGGARKPKQRRVEAELEAEREAELERSRWVCLALNNAGLASMAKGGTNEACEHLKRALQLSPRNEIRPAFNLTVLLWRSSRFREASQVWMPRRYPVLAAGQGEAPQEMYRSIISEVEVRRSKILSETHDGSRIASHVPSRAHVAISPLQLCLLDLTILEYELSRLLPYSPVALPSLG